jgi:hypothetical protein
MRRRLWWALVLFDTRIGELTSSKTFVTLLTPTWDCRVPLNVNDTQLRFEMKEPPQIEGTSSEALFAVVRSRLGDFVRHTMFNSGSGFRFSAFQQGSLSNPTELVILERMIEDKHLRFCDPENPLHFMTIWTAHGYLAKTRFLEHQSKYSGLAPLDEAKDHVATIYALKMLECDTKLMSSPLVRGFLWFTESLFPFTAYIQIVQHLKWQPHSEHREKAWETMSDNYDARFDFLDAEAPMFKLFTSVVLQAWEVREKTCKESGKSLVIPRIVLSIRHKLAQTTPNTQILHTGMSYDVAAFELPDLSVPIPITSHDEPMFYNVDVPGIYGLVNPRIHSNMYGMPQLNEDINQLGWPAMDWDLVHAPTVESSHPFRPQ